MTNILRKGYIGKSVAISIMGFLVILSGILTGVTNHYVIGIVMVIAAVALYALTVFWVAQRNWLDIRAVFTGVWIATIGLAALRLADYQEQWLNKTWLLLAISYLMYQVGAEIGICNGGKIFEISKKCLSKLKTDRISLVLHEERLFPICIVVTIIGVICFSINIAIRGYIPAFSDSTTAYVDFYTKFHIFSVAATAVSGLCYYCIKTQPISKTKKAILWGCIFYLVVLFPILVVSRGVFLVAALALSTSIFYLNKRKLTVFIACLVAMAGIYMFTSNLRGYSDAQLDMWFEPTEIEIETDEEGNESSFALPPKLAFLYGYFTSTHDNFNEAVENTVDYTWGARQFHPFNVILRIPALTDMRNNGEWHQVRPHLNAVNMVGIFYYDFHEWGVVLCTLFWAIVFGLVQGFYMKAKGPFSMFILGFVMNGVALSFFASWVDSFEIWMFCGVILIISIVTWVHIKPKEVRSH